MRGGALAGAVVATVLLAVPAAADASVTVGSNNLEVIPGNVSGPATIATTAAPASAAAAGGVTSPVTGTITTWRLHVGASSGPTSLVVIRPQGGGLYAVAGGSATIIPTPSSTGTYSTSTAVKLGDLIGIEVGAGFNQVMQPVSGATTLGWLGSALGTTPQAPTNVYSAMATMNADVEPSTAFTLAKKDKSLPGGKIRITATPENPGTLRVTGNKFMRKTTKNVNAPGTVKIVVKPTAAALSKLDDRRKLSSKYKISFTPKYGTTPRTYRRTATQKR